VLKGKRQLGEGKEASMVKAGKGKGKSAKSKANKPATPSQLRFAKRA